MPAQPRTLVARTDRRFGEGRFRATFLVAPRFTSAVISRSGMLYDSSFVPCLRDSTPNAMVYLLLEGGLETTGSASALHHAPAALVFDEDTFEGVEGRARTTFRNFGEPLVVIELRVAAADLRVARTGVVQPVELPLPVWDAARSLGSQPDSDESTASAAHHLISALVERGVVNPQVESGPASDGHRHFRLWAAVLPLVEKLDMLGSLDAVSALAGLSVRHLARELDSFTTTYKVPFSKWRETSRRLRLKAAIMALSTRDLSIRDVAVLMGYAGVEAMARAFRDAGAPAPSRVRDELHLARQRLMGRP